MSRVAAITESGRQLAVHDNGETEWEPTSSPSLDNWRKIGFFRILGSRETVWVLALADNRYLERIMPEVGAEVNGVDYVIHGHRMSISRYWQHPNVNRINSLHLCGYSDDTERDTFFAFIVSTLDIEGYAWRLTPEIMDQYNLWRCAHHPVNGNYFAIVSSEDNDLLGLTL